MTVTELRFELPGENRERGRQREDDAEAERQFEERSAGAPAARSAAIAMEIAEEQQLLQGSDRGEVAARG